MKYTCQVEIDLPIEQVVKLWSDESNCSKWQDSFESIELIEGEKDQPNARSLIKFRQGRKKMELIETILTNNLPHEKKGLYEHVHMTNTQTTRFEPISDHKTRYISEVEYTKFNGFIPNLMARFFPGMFRKQSQKWMNQFKAFAESN